MHRLIEAFTAFKKATKSEVQLVIGGRFAWQTGVVKTAYEMSDYQGDQIEKQTCVRDAARPIADTLGRCTNQCLLVYF